MLKTMNKLSSQERAHLLQLLCEGMAIRSIVRVTGVSKNTVAKLLIDAGAVCQAYHDAHVRNLNSRRVQCDEIWSFCYAKQKSVASAKVAPRDAGDIWTWTAMDADSKLAVSWLVGGRDAGYPTEFMNDVAVRLSNRVQMTIDHHKAYLEAVEGAFGADVDYAQLVKMYGASEPEHRYSPAVCIGAKQQPVSGDPDPKHIGTSYVERQNLTMRMSMRRFTRLTNAFSKKVENLAHAVALHFMHYNFCRIHQTLRVTPAIEAGVTDRVWDVANIVELIGAQEWAKDRKRGPYKKRNSN